MCKTEIHKGMCKGCPYDWGSIETEQALNWGCLPEPFQIENEILKSNQAWACHDEPDKICCGWKARNSKKEVTELYREEGVHEISAIMQIKNV